MDDDRGPRLLRGREIPGEYRLRRPTAEDLPVIQRLVDDCEAAETGEQRPSPVCVALSFALPTSEPERNWWLLAQDDTVVGFARIWPQSSRELMGEVFIEQRAAERGLWAPLYAAIEGRAQEIVADHAAWAPSLFTWCDDSNAQRQEILLARGYRRVREVFVMRIEASDDLPTPVWPAGVAAREVRPGVDDAAVWAADVDAFREHFLYDPSPLDAWRAEVFDHPGFDPGCFIVGWDGDEVAGQAIGMPGADPGVACIDDVAVRRPWRGRGLGLALLLEVLRRLHARGRDDIEVWVDAENETGAVRLYEAAGMRVWRHIGVFEFALRGDGGQAGRQVNSTSALTTARTSRPSST